MAFQLSVAARNAGLDAYETAVGTSAKLDLYSGAMPANCAAADSGTLLATISLPSDWMANASAGAKAMTGSWTGTGGAGAGAGTNIGYFRIKDSTNTTCHMQGTVTATGGGGDMTVDNINIANGQAFTVNTFNLTAGNA